MLQVTPGAAKHTELYAGTPTSNTNAIGDQVHSSYLKYVIILSMNFLFSNKGNLVNQYLEFPIIFSVRSNKGLRITS